MIGQEMDIALALKRFYGKLSMFTYLRLATQDNQMPLFQ